MSSRPGPWSGGSSVPYNSHGFSQIALSGAEHSSGATGTLALSLPDGIEGEDEKWMTLRPLVFGNFDLMGVILSYVDDPVPIKRATGWNFVPASVGRALHERLLGYWESGAVRAVVGRTIGFDEIPAGLEVLEQRKVLGRSVVSPRSSDE